MTDFTLADLGWSASIASRVDAEELQTASPARISEVHRDRITAKMPTGDVSLTLPADLSTGDLAVGDWVTVDTAQDRLIGLVARQTLVSRRAAGTDARVQLIAANVDTLMIVTSCNADFNIARLERYLALATGGGTLPLVLLTKADLTDTPAEYRKQAERMSPLVTAIPLDARDREELDRLAPWLGTGQTAALVGSSGVGKSTILNGLTASGAATQTVRQDDAKGRHTTTARSLHRSRFGGWLIDTPGMRELRLNDTGDGVAQVFSDVENLAADCKFSDCAHGSEPGCAVQAAIASGALDVDRFRRWEKLQREDRYSTETVAEARARHRVLGRMIRSVTKTDRR